MSLSLVTPVKEAAYPLNAQPPNTANRTPSSRKPLWGIKSGPACGEAMKVAVVGSRKFQPISEVAVFIGTLPADTEIVSGEVLGVDTAAKGAAREHGLLYRGFPPDRSFGFPAALFLRNTQIVEYADRVIAFWDGSSRGTADTILKTIAARKPLEVHFPNGEVWRGAFAYAYLGRAHGDPGTPV